MKQRSQMSASIAYTPRYCRPELFGSCQLRRETPHHAAA